MSQVWRSSALRRAARDTAARAEAQVERLRRGGKVSGLVQVDAERTAAAAEQALAAAESDISNDQIAVFLALGGGWA